jgi:hypothetical protein
LRRDSKAARSLLRLVGFGGFGARATVVAEAVKVAVEVVWGGAGGGFFLLGIRAPGVSVSTVSSTVGVCLNSSRSRLTRSIGGCRAMGDYRLRLFLMPRPFGPLLRISQLIAIENQSPQDSLVQLK